MILGGHIRVQGRRRTEPSHFSDIGIDVHRNANGAGLARFRAYWERRKHTTNTPCNRQSACWCCTTGRRGLLAILHAAAAHCGQALTTTTDEVTLGCAGLPRRPQPHTTDPLPMVLHHDSNQCVLICRTEGEGAETRVGGQGDTNSTSTREHETRKRRPRVLLPFIQHLHCDHSWTRVPPRRRCTCTRVTRPSACEAATCVHLLCARRWQDWRRRTSLGLQCREALWLKPPPSHATTAICPSQPAQKCPHMRG